MTDVVEVALTALRDDAKVWDKAEEELSGVQTTAKGLKCGNSELSFMADLTGLTDRYNEFQEKLATLAGEGEKFSGDVADALRAAADTYEQEEEEGVHRMNDVW